MSHQGRLLLYVMEQQRMNEAQARAWLNTHCPRWQSNEPITVGVIEQEEVTDGDI